MTRFKRHISAAKRLSGILIPWFLLLLTTSQFWAMKVFVTHESRTLVVMYHLAQEKGDQYMQEHIRSLPAAEQPAALKNYGVTSLGEIQKQIDASETTVSGLEVSLDAEQSQQRLAILCLLLTPIVLSWYLCFRLSIAIKRYRAQRKPPTQRVQGHIVA